jgi:hypothetical protein
VIHAVGLAVDRLNAPPEGILAEFFLADKGALFVVASSRSKIEDSILSALEWFKQRGARFYFLDR